MDQPHGESHIAVLFFLFRHIQKYTCLCRNDDEEVTQEQNQKKTEEPCGVQDPVMCRPPEDCHAARQKAFAPTGPAVSPSEGQHVHQYSFHPSTVDGFGCGKLRETNGSDSIFTRTVRISSTFRKNATTLHTTRKNIYVETKNYKWIKSEFFPLPISEGHLYEVIVCSI